MVGVSTKDIKNRIKSLESTKQITKAMEMVASSKLRRAQAQVTGSRPYFEVLRSTIDTIAAINRDFSSPYLHHRSGNRAAFVVIAGDRGLAGGYNSNVLKMTYGRMQGKDVTVIPIGKKSVEFFVGRKVPVLTTAYSEAEDMDIGNCFAIAKQICDSFRAGEYDEVHIAYTGFVSVLSQTPVVMRLLPLDAKKETPKSGSDLVYEPNCEEVFDAIVPEYLGGVIYGALCESRASEQAARRTAMDSATQNADEMISDLYLKYNRARQAAITQEITEIVAGV